MAQPQRQATFFADESGLVICKAPPLTQKQRNYILTTRSLRCEICGDPVRRFGRNYSTPFDSGPRKAHVDHILPRSRGGQNDEENLRILCQRCNCQRGAK